MRKEKGMCSGPRLIQSKKKRDGEAAKWRKLRRTTRLKIKDKSIVPGPMKEVTYFGMDRKPRPRIKNPSRGKIGIRITIAFI
jgi:hypothetical protein